MIDFAARLARLRAEPSTDEARDGARLGRVERSRTEMLAQGPAIAATLVAEAPAVAQIAAWLAKRPIDHVVITGCGDSWFVGMAAKQVFERLLGVPCLAAQAFDYAAYGHVAAGPRTLIIGLSSGGNTPAVMAALELARARGAFAIGVSNTAGSAIMTSFDAALCVHATRRGWPTQASTAAIALLASLALALSRQRMDHLAAASSQAAQHQLETGLLGLPALADAIIASLDTQISQIAHDVALAPQFLFTGAGPFFAAASFGAAKIRELCPVHAFAIPLEEIHHYRLPKHCDHLVIIAPDAASRERALDTALVGEAVGARMLAILGEPDAAISSRIHHVIEAPAAKGMLASIVATIPLHLFAYHVATARAAASAAS